MVCKQTIIEYMRNFDIRWTNQVFKDFWNSKKLWKKLQKFLVFIIIFSFKFCYYKSCLNINYQNIKLKIADLTFIFNNKQESIYHIKDYLTNNIFSN